MIWLDKVVFFLEIMMSDKYYLHDCNSYTHCCQNTYRIERKDVFQKRDIAEKEDSPVPQTLSWWQRLWMRDTQTAKA